MRSQFHGRKRTSVALGTLLAVVVAGGAFAYWTIGGTGSGTATAGTVSEVTVNETSAAVTGLYPGGPAGNLSGDFDNPNDGPVYVSSVTAVVRTFTSQADALKPACTEADFAIGGTANVGRQIASGTAVDAWTGLTVSMANKTTNQDNCKGVTIDIDYTANP